MGQTPCHLLAALEPALQSGEANVQFIGNTLLRAISALAQLAQRLFFEFWGMCFLVHVCRSSGASAVKKGGDN
jgi:hypothetical protein